MHVYAEAVIDSLGPSRCGKFLSKSPPLLIELYESYAFLDSYPVLSYISSEASFDVPPIRYLSTNKSRMVWSNVYLKYFYLLMYLQMSTAQPFMPPNLLQSTTSSFLAILSVRHSQQRGTPMFSSILLPSPKTTYHISTKLARSKDLPIEWSTQLMSMVNHDLFLAVGEKANLMWGTEGNDKLRDYIPTAMNSDLGEGGMYI
jgi:hypothetical protein